MYVIVGIKETSQKAVERETIKTSAVPLFVVHLKFQTKALTINCPSNALKSSNLDRKVFGNQMIVLKNYHDIDLKL